MMALTKDGLVLYHPGRHRPKPQSLRGLLTYWHATVERIEEGYTLGDLLDLLGAVRRIKDLSPMVGCDVAALLEEAALPPLPRGGGTETKISPTRHRTLDGDPSPGRQEPDSLFRRSQTVAGELVTNPPAHPFDPRENAIHAAIRRIRT